jgi:Ca-activated chloride channel family protein
METGGTLFNDFRFADPRWLTWLAGVPVLYFLLLWDERRRKKQMEQFADPHVWERILPGHDPGARSTKVLFLCLSLIFAILTLARPQWGMREEVLKTTGLDIMVLLDVSNSMETEDVTPNRLRKAKHWLSTFLDQVPGDRVGVVAFADSGYVAAPLTTDHGYVREVVDLLSPASVTAQGTNIGAALALARKSLERGSEDLLFSPTKSTTTHAIVVLSDGEDHEGQAKQAATDLSKFGIRVFTVGIGTGKGGPVPSRDLKGNLLTYKKDFSGQTVISQLKPDDLMDIAQAGGGKYWTASADERETEELASELSGMSRSEFAERKRLIYEERFQYPLAICLLFLIIEMSVSLTRKREEGQTSAIPAGATGTMALLALAFLFPSLSNANSAGIVDTWEAYQENEVGIDALKRGDFEAARRAFGAAQARDPSVPELEYNQGITQFQEGQVDEAIRRFEGAAQGAQQRRDSKLEAEALFNLGVAQAQKGEKKDALNSYLKALDSAEKARRQAGVEEESQIEKDLRKNIELLQREDPKQNQQQQQQQQEQQKKDQQQDQSQNQKDQSQGDPDQKDPKDQKQQRAQETGRQKRFKSEKLSAEDAERVMAELGNKERELKAKLNQQRGQYGRNPKDW